MSSRLGPVHRPVASPVEGPLSLPVVPYRTRAMEYDGSTNYALRGGGLTSAADGALGMVSFWVQRTATGVHVVADSAPNASQFAAYFQADHTLRIDGLGAGLTLISSATFTDDGAFHHCAAGWDVNTGVAWLAADGVDALDVGASTIPSATTMDYTHTNWGVGDVTSAGAKLAGYLSELYLSTVTYLSLAAAIPRFRLPGGTPRDLGATGTGPTGAQPIIYMPDDPANNLGFGGDFVNQAALSVAPVSPSD